jgi:hypothetical protein
MTEPFLDQLQLRNVARDADQADHLAGSHDRRLGGLNPEWPTELRRLVFNPADNRLARTHCRLFLVKDDLGEFTGIQVKIGLADQIGWIGETAMYGMGAISPRKARCAILRVDQIGHAVHERLQEGTLVPQLLVNPGGGGSVNYGGQ